MGTPKRSDAVRRALRLSLALNGGYMLVELIVGFTSGSLALLSDAAHMFSDSAALLLALLVAELTRKPAIPKRSFGLLRAEALGAFTNGLLLLAACGLIIFHAIERLAGEAPPFPALPVMIVAAIGLAINLGSAWLLARSDRDNINVRGALAHMMADALGSVGALLAAFLAWGWGYNFADPLISLGIAALILITTWRLLRDASHALLDFVPREVDPSQIRAALEAIEGVSTVHELHLWGMGRQTVLTAHLVTKPGVSSKALLCRAETLLRDDLGIAHTTLQLDDVDTSPCAQVNCPLFRETQATPAHHGHRH